jgi:hypothetical protein
MSSKITPDLNLHSIVTRKMSFLCSEFIAQLALMKSSVLTERAPAGQLLLLGVCM